MQVDFYSRDICSISFLIRSYSAASVSVDSLIAGTERSMFLPPMQTFTFAVALPQSGQRSGRLSAGKVYRQALQVYKFIVEFSFIRKHAFLAGVDGGFMDDSCRKDRSLGRSGHPVCRCSTCSQSCSEMRCSKQSFLLFSSLYILIYLLSTSSTYKNILKEIYIYRNSPLTQSHHPYSPQDHRGFR